MEKPLHVILMWQPSPLPYPFDLESKNVLRRLSGAHRALAELKGIADTIPNQGILLNTLALQEAKDSSEVENIVTTHDELYKAHLNLETVQAMAAKEVQNYIEALEYGFFLIEEHGLLTMNHIRAIQETLEKNSAGFRKVPGTTLRNESTAQEPSSLSPPSTQMRLSSCSTTWSGTSTMILCKTLMY